MQLLTAIGMKIQSIFTQPRKGVGTEEKRKKNLDELLKETFLDLTLPVSQQSTLPEESMGTSRAGVQGDASKEAIANCRDCQSQSCFTLLHSICCQPLLQNSYTHCCAKKLPNLNFVTFRLLWHKLSDLKPAHSVLVLQTLCDCCSPILNGDNGSTQLQS